MAQISDEIEMMRKEWIVLKGAGDKLLLCGARWWSYERLVRKGWESVEKVDECRKEVSER